jgi:uncharacterized protein (DUF1330 family)
LALRPFKRCMPRLSPPHMSSQRSTSSTRVPYDKEYVPPAAKAIADGGGKYVVRGGDTAAFFGEPPKPRIAVMVFESMEKARAAFDSSAYREAKKVGDKYAKFRVYAVEGLPQ